MSILDNERLRSLIPDSVEPYDLNRVDDAHYELSLGDEYFATNNESGVKTGIKEGDQIRIQPGQFALLLTKETVTIPADIIAFISIKASIKFRGLINVSGFHVDPGFHGKLKFGVYNAGSKEIVLDWGQQLFPMWFCRLSGTNERYDGSHNNQTGITSEDVNRINGDIISPNVLNKKFKKLEERIGNINVAIASGITILVVILGLFLGKYLDNSASSAVIQATERHLRTETNVNSLSANINVLSNSVNTQESSLANIEKRLAEIERKVK